MTIAPSSFVLAIRPLAPRDLGQASALALRVFASCVGPGCTPQGCAAFASCVTPEELLAQVKRGELLLGAFAGEVMTGMLVIRRPGHVANFFVDERCHRQGIGRALFQEAERLLAGPGGEAPAMTVNSSLFAVRFYERLGFVRIGAEIRKNGLRCAPMRRPSGPRPRAGGSPGTSPGAS